MHGRFEHKLAHQFEICSFVRRFPDIGISTLIEPDVYAALQDWVAKYKVAMTT